MRDQSGNAVTTMQPTGGIRPVWPLLLLMAACGPSSGGESSQGMAPGEKAAARDTCGAFWEMLQNVGDYAERFSTFQELVRGSDLIAFGPLVPYDDQMPTGSPSGAEPAPGSPRISLSLGSSPEILKGRLETPELLLTGVPPLESDCLPSSPVLVLARWWEAAQVYRPVNGYGIWAPTNRAAVDTPLILDRMVDGQLYEEELSQYRSFEDFVDAVRDLASQP